ncbi:MAG TPA: flagellar biosynthetic protein FliO [Polyangiaceae bacterium]|jgi:flagellar biogenesis protein FliO
MTPLRQYVSAALLGACLALGAASAHAQEGPDASVKGPSWLAPRSGPKLARPVAAGPSVGLGRSMGVLLLTSVLGGTALYLRSRKNQPTKARLSQLRVLGSTKLGGRASLVLAEVAGRQILLGVTDNSVRKLGWLEAEAVEDELLAPAARPRLVAAGVDLAARPARAAAEPAPAPAKRSFRDFLASAVGNIGGPAADDSAASTLAAETQDTFTRSTPRAAEARRAEPARKGNNPLMLDVEGQARGLLARLGEPRA